MVLLILVGIISYWFTQRFWQMQKKQSVLYVKTRQLQNELVNARLGNSEVWIQLEEESASRQRRFELAIAQNYCTMCGRILDGYGVTLEIADLYEQLKKELAGIEQASDFIIVVKKFIEKLENGEVDES